MHPAGCTRLQSSFCPDFILIDGSFILAARTRTDEVQFDLRDGGDGAGGGALGGGCAGLHHVERLFGDAAHLGRGSGPAIRVVSNQLPVHPDSELESF